MTSKPAKEDPTGDTSDRVAAGPEAPDSQAITARLAAAASRRADLETLLAAAPSDATLQQFRSLVIEQNVAGKGSAVSRQKLWEQLRERYILDRSTPEGAAFLAAMADTSGAAERGLLCLLIMAWTDRLFREMTLATLSPRLDRDGVELTSNQAQFELESYLQEHKLTWKPDTVEHVRQHLLASLKDFGLLRGSRGKRTVRPHPGTQFTLLAARLSRLEGLTPRQTLQSRWFRLLGFRPEQVADLLYSASREGALQFQMQAEVVDLELPELEAASQ